MTYRSNRIPSEISNQFNSILEKIPATQPLLLFPVRLETKFRYIQKKTKKKQKQLCVRIIPDEIMLDYCQNDKLSSEEVYDGKAFWAQWYIASGCEKREYEAWENLCTKYPVRRAAWIINRVRPYDLASFRADGKNYAHRPFVFAEDSNLVSGSEAIERKCLEIYKIAVSFDFDGLGSELSESNVEKQTRECLNKISIRLFDIETILSSCELIVDYLYDNVHETILYLQRKLETLSAIYQKYPYMSKSRKMDLWDADSYMLAEMREKVNHFLEKLDYKRMTLNDMIDLCLNEKKIDFMVMNENGGSKDEINIPVSNCLPDQFLLIAEQDFSDKVYYKLSNKVDRANIQMGLKPNSDDESADVADALLNGELDLNPKLQWLTDYEVAEKRGMAISLDIDDNVSKFKYIYVVGVRANYKKSENRLKDLKNLFLGHNFVNSDMRFIGAGTPTNILNEEQKSEEIDFKRLRYDIEVNEIFKNFGNSGENLRYADEDDDITGSDARKLGYMLKTKRANENYNVDYGNVWGHVIGFDSRQDYFAKIAYGELWDIVFGSEKAPKIADAELLRDFVINHVRARGNLPSILVDNLPYGILPVVDFCAMSSQCSKKKDFVSKLLNVLIKLADLWQNNRNKNVKWAEKFYKSANFLEMAEQTPYSTDFAERCVLKSDFIPEIDSGNATIVNVLKESGFVNEIPFGEVCKHSSEKFNEWKNSVTSKLVEKGMSEDVAEKEAAMYTAEFLDLFTCRIDAWFSGIIDYYYMARRKTIDSPYVGAFGWAFKLEESTRQKIENETERKNIIDKMGLNASKIGDLYKGANDAHFIMAPSIQHALSAVVLRSSYLQSKKGSNLQNCVNLSSMRTRQALRLVNGVKSGMALSVILGTDFERYLHEAYAVYGFEMDDYIYPLRQLFPQVIDIKAQDDRAADYIMQVVNAEALINTFLEKWGWKGSVSEWLESNWGDIELISNFVKFKKIDVSSKKQERKTFFKLIERVVDSYDALNDLLLSEGVHRLIMGDKASYYAISSFLAKGEGNLPDPEILKIPSEHVVVCHKAGVLLPKVIETSNKVMRFAEPALNSWIESQLGGMNNILFFIKVNDEKPVPVSLADVNISGIEYLYLSSFEKSFHKYVETRWRINESHYGEDVEFIANADVAGYDCVGSQLSLGENKLRMDALRGIVARGRAMNARDWFGDICDDLTEENQYDLKEFSDRFDDTIVLFKSVVSAASKWIEKTEKNAAFDDECVSEAYSILCSCYELGLLNCLEDFKSSAFIGDLTQTSNLVEYEKICSVQKDLRQSVIIARDSLSTRLADAEAILASGKSYDALLSAFQTLILSNFKVFPKFDYKKAVEGKYEGSVVGDISKVMYSSVGAIYDNIDKNKLNQWQDDVAEVRDGMKLMRNFEMFQTAIDQNSDDAVLIQSSAYAIGLSESKYEILYRKWLGAEVDDEKYLRDADSLILYNKSAFSSSVEKYSGFVFDSWIEYIPYKKHDAGFAFHNDWPDNEAPQAMLLAWPPKLPVLKNTHAGSWDLSMLVDVLPTTRFMMMNRAVDADYVFGDSVLATLPVLPHINDEELNK